MREDLEHILNDASLESGLIVKLTDQLLQTEESVIPGINIDKHTLAESLLAWEKLPWIGDEKILKLAIIANYCKDNNSKFYHFLQASCNSTRVLFIRHSKCYVELKTFAESLIGQSKIFSLVNITPAERAELAFAYVTTSALYEQIPESVRVKLLQLSLSYVENACIDDIAASLPPQLRLLPVKKLNTAHMAIYARKWIASLVGTMLEPEPFKFVHRLQSVFQLQFSPEKLSFEEVQSLLSSAALAQAKEVNNIYILWLLIIKLTYEHKISDAAVLLHLVAQYPDLELSTFSKWCFRLLGKIEGDVQRRHVQQVFFPRPASNDITAGFYGGLHDPEKHEQSAETISKFMLSLIKSNVERYMQLLMATSLAQSAEYLQSQWFVDMQEILATTKNKVTVIQQIITQYKNIYRREDDHLTWLEALSYFYSKDYDSAANLFRELMDKPDGSYVIRARIILDVCRPHLSAASEKFIPKA